MHCLIAFNYFGDAVHCILHVYSGTPLWCILIQALSDLLKKSTADIK